MLRTWIRGGCGVSHAAAESVVVLRHREHTPAVELSGSLRRADVACPGGQPTNAAISSVRSSSGIATQYPVTGWAVTGDPFFTRLKARYILFSPGETTFEAANIVDSNPINKQNSQRGLTEKGRVQVASPTFGPLIPSTFFRRLIPSPFSAVSLPISATKASFEIDFRDLHHPQQIRT